MALQLKSTYTFRASKGAYTPRSAALLHREGILVVSDTSGVLHSYDVLAGEKLSVSGKGQEEH